MPAFIKFSGVEGESKAFGYEGWTIVREITENAGAEMSIQPMSPTLVDEWREAERLFKSNKYLPALDILRPMSIQSRTSVNDAMITKAEQLIEECEKQVDELKLPDKKRGRYHQREPGFNVTLEIDRSFPDLISRAAELVDIDPASRRNHFDEINIHLCTSFKSKKGLKPYLMCKIEQARIKSFTLDVNAEGGNAIPTGRLVIDYGNDAQRITWSYNTDLGTTVDTLLLEKAHEHVASSPLKHAQHRLEAASRTRFPSGFDHATENGGPRFPGGYDYDTFRGGLSFPAGYWPAPGEKPKRKRKKSR